MGKTNRREDYYLHRGRSSWGDENISPFIVPSVASSNHEHSYKTQQQGLSQHCHIHILSLKERTIKIRAWSSPGFQDDWFQWVCPHAARAGYKTHGKRLQSSSLASQASDSVDYEICFRRQSPHDDGNYTCITLWFVEYFTLFNSINLIIKSQLSKIKWLSKAKLTKVKVRFTNKLRTVAGDRASLQNKCSLLLFKV